MRSADPGDRAGGCISRVPAESGTRRYRGSVVVVSLCVLALRVLWCCVCGISSAADAVR